MIEHIRIKLRSAPEPVRAACASLKKGLKRAAMVSAALAVLVLLVPTVHANAASVSFDLGGDGTTAGSQTLQLLFVFVMLAVAPFLLLMMTSFTRIVIVFSFLRSAIGLQSTPPNQVIIGLALALTMFIMMPVFTQINDESIQPLMSNKITAQQAIDKAQVPIKEFMLKQTKAKDLNLFLNISNNATQASSSEASSASQADSNAPGQNATDTESIEQLESLSLAVIVPAFITSELKRAFTMGFLLYLPFLVIDMIVSSTLMSMGMVMLPPSTIAMPFKLMLFVLVDGWSLIMDMLVRSFH
ncbi:MAG: flagellar type III secretion system pore protein FliP [Faecalibacterium sp.]|jgi:flagellar biosynthetic protein FliP|nr:flagellar type III secretion system pore protein FliP [Faecalibacterium sp.]